MEESLDILQDDELMESQRVSRWQAAAGQSVPRTFRCRTGLVFEVEITVTRKGLRHLDRLPSKVRDAAFQAILGPIAERPRRVGKSMVGELTGL